MSFFKRATLLALLSTAFVAGAHAADHYPSKPVRIVVPVSAGGGVDTMARLIATHLRNELGQTFIVENRPGAGGNIGLDHLAKSAPDGYTLAIIPNTMTINHTLMDKLPFDTLKSFAPVIQIGTTPAVLGGRGNLPFDTLDALLDHARKNPGTLTFAGCDTGSALHLAGEMFKLQTKTDLTHVPYKGCADSVPNVLGGQVDLIFITLTNIAAYAKEKRMRIFAVASDQRLAFAPDLPTGAEQGLPDFNVDVWYGMLAPAGTPEPILKKLNEAVNKILKKDDIQSSLATSYLTAVGGTPADFSEKIRSDVERYGAVIKRANIRID